MDEESDEAYVGENEENRSDSGIFSSRKNIANLVMEKLWYSYYYKMKVIFVRHGESLNNKLGREGVPYGSHLYKADPPLTEKGEKEAGSGKKEERTD